MQYTEVVKDSLINVSEREVLIKVNEMQNAK